MFKWFLRFLCFVPFRIVAILIGGFVIIKFIHTVISNDVQNLILLSSAFILLLISMIILWNPGKVDILVKHIYSYWISIIVSINQLINSSDHLAVHHWWIIYWWIFYTTILAVVTLQNRPGFLVLDFLVYCITEFSGISMDDKDSSSFI